MVASLGEVARDRAEPAAHRPRMRRRPLQRRERHVLQQIVGMLVADQGARQPAQSGGVLQQSGFDGAGHRLDAIYPEPGGRMTARLETTGYHAAFALPHQEDCMHQGIACSTLLCCLAVAQDPAPPAPPRPIDFQKVDRTPPKLPPSKATRQYGIYLFGDDGQHRVWAVLESDQGKGPPTRLYFDRNGNGDLTEAGECIDGERVKRDGGELLESTDVKFTLGDYRSPGSDAVHKDFTVTWTAKSGVRFRTLWRGEKVSFGGYGPSRETYAGFGDSPQQAPVFVPGWDRAFQFERWIAEPLKRGGKVDFKVFVGNRGDRVGTFSAVDDEFLAAGEYAVATLFYRTKDGKQATARYDLKERC